MSDATDWAAGRDAAWYNRPDVRTVKAIHMAGQPCREGIMSRCGRSVLDRDFTWIPKDVPSGLRCRSNGCRQAWPKAGDAQTPPTEGDQVT